MQIAQQIKQVYLRSKDDYSIALWLVVRETESVYVVGKSIEVPTNSGGIERVLSKENQIELRKDIYVPATREEYEEEVWGTEMRGYVIGKLYKGNRVRAKWLRKIEEMIRDDDF